MPAYKDKKNNKWYTSFYYTNWQGEKIKKKKSGFATKKEALEWEMKFKQIEASDLDMNFAEFVKIYEKDIKPRLRKNTWMSKEVIIRLKILPFFGKKQIKNIKPSDIIKWQNTLMAYRDKNGKSYSPPYLRTIQAQLSAIFNHAVRLYGLKKNPVQIAGTMGGKKKGETTIWTKEQYLKFSEAISDRPESYFAFEILYWCGLRLGEMLALTSKDIDTVNNIISVTKSLQSIKGEIVVTPPKTEKGIRTVPIPNFLSEELEQYKELVYGLRPGDRLFNTSKGYMHHEMDRGSKLAGVPRIRIHDLRHSHISLLIDMGFSLVDIANRVGHESIEITMRYAHAFPEKQFEIADKLNEFAEQREVA